MPAEWAPRLPNHVLIILALHHDRTTSDCLYPPCHRSTSARSRNNRTRARTHGGGGAPPPPRPRPRCKARLAKTRVMPIRLIRQMMPLARHDPLLAQHHAAHLPGDSPSPLSRQLARQTERSPTTFVPGAPTCDVLTLNILGLGLSQTTSREPASRSPSPTPSDPAPHVQRSHAGQSATTSLDRSRARLARMAGSAGVRRALHSLQVGRKLVVTRTPAIRRRRPARAVL
ncbi:hypothetical protein CALCODRAFT_176966 [Calocera cornea HHB12733]|uniref:Uncharacterized protein n=1 Tax=Calocera cornea HHB12733 TaxID=1353952 RepID=A0A165HVQ2_9BASI|nr:hypothetical protein CALCODRAFT_176966 [Calocera cornea HHB12733]